MRSGSGSGDADTPGAEEVDARFVLDIGTLVRCEARIGIMRRRTAQSKATPNPLWNETLHLKVPHPTAVLHVCILQENVGEVDSEPFATAQIALASLLTLTCFLPPWLLRVKS